MSARTSGAFVNELEHFLDCIREGRQPLVSVEDGIEALRMALAMEAAAASSATIDLETYGAAELTQGGRR